MSGGTEPRAPAGLDEALGAEFLELTADRVVMRLAIRPDHHQPFGIVHGGVYCSLVESSASMGAAAWYGTRGNVVGVSNQTDFLRSLREGVVIATAEPIHRGRTTQLWEVRIRDEQERLVAKGQVRIANLEGD
jgi:1,4-dihydroxy-2-naphthoyl-CoA hydrolase